MSYESAECITISHLLAFRHVHITPHHNGTWYIIHRILQNKKQKEEKEEIRKEENERNNEDIHLLIVCHLVRRDCQNTPASFESW